MRKKQKDEVTERQRLCSTVQARKVFLNYTNKGAEMQNRDGEQYLSYWQKKVPRQHFNSGQIRNLT